MEILQLLGVAVGLASLAGLNLYLTVFLTGLAVRFEGSGRVAGQFPAPGEPLGPGDQVSVVLR